MMPRKNHTLAWAFGILICSVLLGCTGEPDRSIMGKQDLQHDLTHEPEWSKVPALRRIPVNSDLFLARSVRPPIPKKIADRTISLRFSKGTATINDLVGIMDIEGIPVIIHSSGGTGISPDEIGATVLPFRRFDGTIGDLVKRIGQSLDLAVWWEDGTLGISDRDRYVVSVPQQQDVIDSVIGELEDFGAEDISPSLYGGRIIYNAHPQLNEEVIVPYLNGLAGNLAEITLQVAVVQLQLTDVSQRGIDWSSFQVQFGDPALATAGSLLAPTAAASATTSTTTTTGTTTPTTSPTVYGNYGAATGTTSVATAAGTTGTINGFSVGKIASTAVGIGGAIEYLSQFGRTSTQQMVELRTLAGQPVQLASTQTTPYVQGLSGTSATTSGSSNVTTSVSTSTVDTGLTMGFTPYYDSMMGLVIVDVNIQVSTLLALETLSYGSAGSASNPQQTIQQPKTQKNKIVDLVRIPAGEVVILGGLHEEDRAQSRTAPFDDYDDLGSKSDNNATTFIFFIMRPVVTIFDPKSAAINTTLPGNGIDTSGKVFEPEGTRTPPAPDTDILPPPPTRSQPPKSKYPTHEGGDDSEEDKSTQAGDTSTPAPPTPVLAKPTPTQNNTLKDNADDHSKNSDPALDDVLQGGFGGATGLETQGLP